MEKNFRKRIEKNYTEHVDALYRHAFYRCGSKDTARDIVQEVYVKYTLYLQSGKKIKNDKSFLYQSVRNKVVDAFRKKKTTSLDELQEGGFDPAEENTGIAQIEKHAEKGQLLVVLEKLQNNQYKEVLLLRYLDGLEVSQIATLLGESPNVVSVRLNRAIKSLKNIVNSSL
jgi:RNA polymerase sigma-70 factor (ECF subfamily)